MILCGICKKGALRLLDKTRGRYLWLLILFVATASLSWWWQSNQRKGRYQDLFPALYVMGVVKFHYYQPVSLIDLWQAYLEHGNISDTLKTLGDPYTRFLAKSEFAELRKETKGTFGGIGIYLIPQAEELIISSVVSGSPGDQVGLQQGDRIVTVDGSQVNELGNEVAVAKIRGEAGTKVDLGIVRGEGEKRRDFNISVKRANILIPTVELEIKSDPVLGKYAYVKISQFAETTAADLQKKLAEIEEALVGNLILDLRANPGGSLDAAIKVAGSFLPQETPILHVLRKGYAQQTLKSSEQGITDMPMVVLMDSWSASASEIVAGALKDQERAFLIGTNTFGKDLIQEVRELPGGNGVTITIASYLTSGRINIHKKGVSPHKIVEIPGAWDQLLQEGKADLFLEMQKLQEEKAVEYLREIMTEKHELAS